MLGKATGVPDVWTREWRGRAGCRALGIGHLCPAVPAGYKIRIEDGEDRIFVGWVFFLALFFSQLTQDTKALGDVLTGGSFEASTRRHLTSYSLRLKM